MSLLTNPLNMFTKPKPQSLELEMEKLEQRVKRKPMSHASQVLRALQMAGSVGVTGRQLGRIDSRYSTRLSDLRRDGHVIISYRMLGGGWRFVLRDTPNE